MSYTIWEALAETSWWVYWMFACMLYLAWLATKPRIIFLKPAIFIQGLFIGISLVCVPFIAGMNLPNLLIWSGCLLTGILLGWLECLSSNIRAVRNTAQVHMPGSWKLFLFILIFIVAKFYYFGRQIIVVDASLLKDKKFIHYFLIVTGLFAGLFIGRIRYLLRCVKTGPYVD